MSYHQEKKLHVRNRQIFYLQKKTDLFDNYVPLWKHFYGVKKCGKFFVCVKDAVKQTIWFLANRFFKHDIWTCCENCG